MTQNRLLAATLVAASLFGSVSLAQAVVPGSDTYERAAENAAIQSVIAGNPSPASASVTRGETTYGYPNQDAGTVRGLVPGSDTFQDAADGRSLRSVVIGQPEGTFRAVPSVSGRLVPGSDSY